MALGDFNLGTAYGAIVISTEGIQNAVREAQGLLDGLVSGVGQSLTQFGDQVANIGQNLTLLTAPIAAFGVAGIRAASDFEGAMTEISARTGLVGEDLQQVSEFAQQMGADTIYSAQEAAEAMLGLLASGQSVEQAMATLPIVLQTAAASGGDLGRTAEGITAILAGFQLQVDRLSPSTRALADELGVTNDELIAFQNGGDPGDVDMTSEAISRLAQSMGMTNAEFYTYLNWNEDAATVSDTLARAAGASQASIQGLQDAFVNVGPVAAGYGFSVNQTAAALAVLSQNGIQGAEAGTALKSMLQNMVRPTDDVQGAWDALGTSLYLSLIHI